MMCRFSFKHMKTSEALQEYAEAKILEKINRYSTKPIEAHLTFEVEGLDHHTHLNLHGGDGFAFQVDSTCQDMYGSIDILVDKLSAQLKKHKDKLKNHKGVHNIRELRPAEIVDREECDSVPVDAADLLKYEQARHKA